MTRSPRIERNAQGVVTKVWVSSIDGAGKELLLEAIAERIGEAVIETNVTVRPQDGRIRAQFFELGAVVEEIPCEDGSVEMHLRIQESSLRKITRNKLSGTIRSLDNAYNKVCRRITVSTCTIVVGEWVSHALLLGDENGLE